MSDFSPISRSMRQRCPIAPYLYILQAEPMAQSIRENKTIEGIPLPSHDENHRTEAKISMFADDTEICVSNERSITKTFNTLEVYCIHVASGAKLNKKKTKGLYIGRWKNKNPV